MRRQAREPASLKTIRRRAVSPVLRWEAVGPDQEFRIVVRDQDTGEERIVYRGFHTECRLPPDLRLTPNQLAFRVMARPIGEAEAEFTRVQEHRSIPRLGDDYETPAADLLTIEPVAGAAWYRLVVRNPKGGRPLVDLVHEKPHFLLPPGRLRDGVFKCELKARVRDRWRTISVHEVTPQMIAAADARADRLVPLPQPEPPKVRGAPADHAPGRAERLAEAALDTGSRLLVVADVTAMPDAAPVADPADVARRQWWAGDGSGAVESVALALETHGLKGQFQLDVLAGEALGDDAVAALARALSSRGHGLGLLVNPEPWRGLSPEMAGMKRGAVLKYALKRFAEVTGQTAQVVSFGPNLLAPARLRQARTQGVRVVLADRADQTRLAGWMRWRTAPFAAYDDMVVIPSAMILSTPAHAKDRPVRHVLSAADALAAAHGQTVAAALAGARGRGLVVARIDPLGLLLRRMVRSSEQAEAWNLALAESLPSWSEAGWDRSAHGFAVLDDRDEIKSEMMTGLIAALARSGVAPADPAAVFSPGALRAWCEDAGAFEPMVEQRRGPRVLRRSGVRRYDAAFRQALGAPPA